MNIGNAHGATQGENSLDVLKFSTNHAMMEQILVESSLVLPLSQDGLLDIPCDKDDVCDDTYVIPMQALIKEHAICLSESNTCAENRHFHHIASDVDELKLLSSLNPIGYIEFDILCSLNDLEEKIFVHANFPWLSKH
jgi:hypothetical protein